MKALTLYIDKWYIIGAVCTDGVPRLIKPKNNEECFWLYFYEDVVNDEIVYGKDNKQHFHNNDNHYIGDVFSLLVDGTSYFSRYGHKQSIDKIFKAAGIIDEWKNAFGVTEGKIETYISFARDISDAARYVFLKEVLGPENFEIKESVARIGHLALEYACRNGIFSEAGYYLLLNACNENLLYSLYEFKDGLFLRKAENTLSGMGTDLRSRALLESVVKSINQRNHFLNSEKEIEDEYLRLNQFVDSWIVKLENARPGRPVTIPNVSFSGLGNTFQATILKKDIDARTHVIVDDIIREIVTFVRENNVNNVTMKGVLFLGNTFTNSQFLSAIKEQYTLPDQSYVYYRKKDLPNIVAVYTRMDCSQFSVATQASVRQGEAQLESQKLAREERERQRIAEEKRQKQEEEYKAAHEAEIRYEEAMRNVYDFEKNQDYAQMAEWAGIALQHKPEDSEALKKKNDATRLISEQKVREEQYRGFITRAQECFKNGQWQDAKSQSEAALNLKPESVEAKKIYSQSTKKIEVAAEIDKYLTRADLFLAQKSYDAALRELAKVQSLEPENTEATQRIQEIADIRKEYTQQIASLEEKYKKAKSAQNYDTAIETCEQLTEIDTINQRKWTAEAERLKAERDKAEEEQKRWNELVRDIDSAHLTEDWKKLNSLCKKALNIREDSDIRSKFEKSEDKLAEIQKNEQFVKIMSEINELAVKKAFDEANDKLNSLERSLRKEGFLDAAKEAQIRDTRRSLFDFGQSSSDVPNKNDASDGSNERTVIKGFKTEDKQKNKEKGHNEPKRKPVVNPDFDWDFGSPQKKNKPVSRPQPNPERKQSKTDDGFFDSVSVSRTQAKSSSSKPKGKITNDDFDF